jgi:alpha-N-arabinofuranosidase
MQYREAKVDPGRTLHRAERRIIGINVNYLNDGGSIARAARPLEQALREMGVASIRFPGGDKSDNYLWSVAPYERPQPTLAIKSRYLTPGKIREFVEPDGVTFRHKTLDFDDFIGMCKRLGAEPTVVVPYDCLFTPPDEGSAAPKLEALVENAAQWVRYANVTKKYGVCYWAVGNESYLAKEFISAKNYAEHFPMFARAMKAVDPRILVGANGPNSPQDPGKHDEAKGDKTPWWKAVLEKGAADIDFMDLHSYPCWRWRKYEYWLEHEQSLPVDMAGGYEALRRWAPAHAERIRVTISEANSADWSSSLDDKKGWPHLNDLGHALVLGDMLGSALLLPYVDMLCVWNTRWINDGRRGSLWDTLDPDNGLAPTGQVLAAWGNNLLDEMIPAEIDGPARIYACASASRSRLSVFMINKGGEPMTVNLVCEGSKKSLAGRLCRFTGTGPGDMAPIWLPEAPLMSLGGKIHVELAPYSLSVMRLET